MKKTETYKTRKFNWNIKDLKTMNVIDISKKYKCNKTTVYNVFRKLNIKREKYVFSKSHKEKIKKNHADVSGDLNPNYKDGASLIKYYCVDCKKEVEYKSSRCGLCHNRKNSKRLHSDDNFLKRSLVGFFKRAKCTGKSKIFLSFLNYFYPNKFKYVGDGTLIIERYTPDFFDGNNMLIEFFGGYWHKKERAIKTDRRKLKRYKINGYRCLVVWEKELENIEKIKLKIDKFINKDITNEVL